MEFGTLFGIGTGYALFLGMAFTLIIFLLSWSSNNGPLVLLASITLCMVATAVSGVLLINWLHAEHTGIGPILFLIVTSTYVAYRLTRLFLGVLTTRWNNRQYKLALEADRREREEEDSNGTAA